MLFNKNRPTLIIDKEKVLTNIQHFTTIAEQNNIIFRPHFKTHQSKEIGKWFLNFGVQKITVSSVSMAQYFMNDWNDILIAFPLNIHELKTIKEISKTIKLNVTISSVKHLNCLIDAGCREARIYIKIDTGYGRSGVEAANTEFIAELIQKLKTEKFKFEGFLSHFGHTYHTNTFHEIEDIYTKEIARLLHLKELAKEYFPDCIISIGDTPGLSHIKNLENIDEIRPGNFVFFDCMQEKLGACSYSDIAVALACPIVEINSKQEKIIVYAGAVHLSKEAIVKQNKPYYGAIVKFNQNNWTEPIENMFVKSLSQEHGIIYCPNSTINAFKVGDILGILPVHSCLTANLMKGYFDFDGKYIDHLNNFF